MGRRKSTDEPVSNLEYDPRACSPPATPEAPVTVAMDKLSVKAGQDLEIMTRTTPQLARAAMAGYTYTSIYGETYVGGFVDTMMRMAVSAGGKGREEILRAAESAKLPAEYFEGGAGGLDVEARE